LLFGTAFCFNLIFFAFNNKRGALAKGGWLFLNVGAFYSPGSFLYVDALAIELLLAFYTRRFGYRVSCYYILASS
jgi:hypothetical protein